MIGNEQGIKCRRCGQELQQVLHNSQMDSLHCNNQKCTLWATIQGSIKKDRLRIFTQKPKSIFPNLSPQYGTIQSHKKMGAYSDS